VLALSLRDVCAHAAGFEALPAPALRRRHREWLKCL
jgi:hypothetical protein